MQWPETLQVGDRAYRPTGVLHRTPTSVNVLYRADGGPLYVLKITCFPSLLTWLLWPLAVYMSWREHRIHRRLEGVPGIPGCGPRVGWRGYSHEFIPGRTLDRLPRGGTLPEGFFRELATLLEALHARGIFYADLDRKANIIIGEDGRPWLIDYQSCLVFTQPRGIWSRTMWRVFERIRQEDHYHLLKHRRCFGDPLTAEELAGLERSGLALWWRRFVLRPWRRVRRLFRARRTKIDPDRSIVSLPETQREQSF